MADETTADPKAVPQSNPAPGAARKDEAPPRQLKDHVGRVIDYLFGRNTLIGLASLMLLVISGYATWSGMHDFIVGVSTSPANASREIGGGLSVSNEMLVVAIVVALTFLMWLALRETFAAGRRLTDRFVTLPLYLFLALWSVGFGYGFWWSLIAGEEATRKGLSGLQEDARDAGQTIAARLGAVKVQLDSVVQWSDSQMAREESSGGSCGIASGAGRGPLYNARRSVRDSVTSLRDSITKAWISPVETDLATLRQSASALEGATVAERREHFEAMARTIRGSARNIAARSNQFGQSTAAEMRALASAVSIEPRKPGFSCYDPTLAQRLRQAADQASAPAVLDLRDAAFNEGPAGVANAVKNLWTNIGSYGASLASYVVSGGQRATGQTASGEPISGRDLIALLATLGIDLGLFAMTFLNPPRTAPNWRLPGAQVRQIRDAIATAIHRAPDTDFEWIRRHFVHHGGKSYFVIPNIFAVDRGRPGEEQRALAMNHLAGVFQDVGLIRELKARELWGLRAEETRRSRTDLTHVRETWQRKTGITESGAISNIARRNHGLLSKAARALDISHWSHAALSDVEVFVLIDRDGLTPLLEVLNDPASAKAADSARAVSVDDPAKHHLKFDETRTLYLAELAASVEIPEPEKAEPVLLRIAERRNDIEAAVDRLLAQPGWQPIANRVLQRRTTMAARILQRSQTVIAAWTRDPRHVYPLSQLPTADLQMAVVTYKLLEAVSEELRHTAPQTERSTSAGSTRAKIIQAAADTVEAYLHAGKDVSMDTLSESLANAARQTAVVPPSLTDQSAANGQRLLQGPDAESDETAKT